MIRQICARDIVNLFLVDSWRKEEDCCDYWQLHHIMLINRYDLIFIITFIKAIVCSIVNS